MGYYQKYASKIGKKITNFHNPTQVTILEINIRSIIWYKNKRYPNEISKKNFRRNSTIGSIITHKNNNFLNNKCNSNYFNFKGYLFAKADIKDSLSISLWKITVDKVLPEFYPQPKLSKSYKLQY